VVGRWHASPATATRLGEEKSPLPHPPTLISVPPIENPNCGILRDGRRRCPTSGGDKSHERRRRRAWSSATAIEKTPSAAHESARGADTGPKRR
jgi:hypothetical protein